jgi:hypothetical protein
LRREPASHAGMARGKGGVTDPAPTQTSGNTSRSRVQKYADHALHAWPAPHPSRSTLLASMSTTTPSGSYLLATSSETGNSQVHTLVPLRADSGSTYYSEDLPTEHPSGPKPWNILCGPSRKRRVPVLVRRVRGCQFPQLRDRSVRRLPVPLPALDVACPFATPSNPPQVASVLHEGVHCGTQRSHQHGHHLRLQFGLGLPPL